MTKRKRLYSILLSIICIISMTVSIPVFAHEESKTEDGLVTTYTYKKGSHKLTNTAQDILDVTYTNTSNGGLDIKIVCNDLVNVGIPSNATGEKWDDVYFYLCGGIIRKQSPANSNGFTADNSKGNFAGRALWYSKGPNGETYTYDDTDYINLGAVPTTSLKSIKCTRPAEDIGITSTRGYHTVPADATYLDKWTYALGKGDINKNKNQKSNQIHYTPFEGTFSLTADQVNKVSKWMANHNFDTITVAMSYPDYAPGSSWEWCSDGCHGTGRIASGNGSTGNPWHNEPICFMSGIGNTVGCVNDHGDDPHIKQDARECTVYGYQGGEGFALSKNLTFNFPTSTASSVTFNPPNTTSINGTLSQKYTMGTPVQTTTVIKPGYHFKQLTNIKGGSTTTIVDANDVQPDNSYIVKKSINVNKDIEYKVETAPNTYSVTYNGNGATGGKTDPSSHTYDATTNNLATNGFTKNGYSFTGWTQYSDGSGNAYVNGHQNVGNFTTQHNGTYPLYARWNPNKYNIKYEYNAPKDVNGNSLESKIVHTNKPSEATYDSWVTISNPTLEGYTFRGWSIEGLSRDVDNYMGASTSSYDTHKAAPDAIISFLPYYYECGGSNAVGADRVYKNLNTGGYSGNSAATWPTVTFSTGAESWTPISYELTLDANSGSFNDGTNSAIKVVSNLEYNQKYTLPTPTRSGYTFLGWQVYSITGESDYKDKINTNTNPLTAGNVPKFAGGQEVYNLCSSDGAAIKLVAIWGHEHAQPTIYNLLLDHTNDYIYADDVDPLGNAEYCYYVNTNQLNDFEFNTTIVVPSSPHWYDLETYKLDLKYPRETDKFIALPVSQTEYTPGTTGIFPGTTKTKENFKIQVEGNAAKTCIPVVTMECTWKDNYTSCQCAQSDLTFKGTPVTIIGDCEIPTIKNLEKLTDLTAIDLREVDEYIVALSGQDDAYINDPSHSSKYPSGLIELCYFKISNLDNLKKANAGTGLAKTNYRKYNSGAGSDGLIYHVDFEDFDLAKLDLETDSEYADTEDMFIGDIEIEYYLKDNVGNVYTNTNITSIFDIDTELKSFTYDPTNYESTVVNIHNQSVLTNVPVFKKGESACLTIETTGFVDGLRIEFPESWYISEKYPLYMYWGDTTEYTDKSLEAITDHVFYLNTEEFNDNLGCWKQNFIFVLPLYADQTDLSQINITAYKGASQIDDPEIQVNHNAGSQLESLSATEHLKVTNESILDDYRDSIRHTY